MPDLSTDNLIKQYYDKVGHKYPFLTYQQFETICKNPFHYFVSEMGKFDMPTIFVKYFGKFVAYSGDVMKMMKYNDLLFTKKIRTKEKHEEIHRTLALIYKRIKKDEKQTFVIVSSDKGRSNSEEDVGLHTGESEI